MTKLSSAIVALFASVSALLPLASQAQDYPTKPIKAIVPFAPGSATDQIGRAFTAKMAEVLGQQIIIENKPGVNGMLGADAVAKAAPDGYTILIGTNSTNAALKSLMKKLPYDQDTAFSPIGFMGAVPLIVTVNKDVPVKTLKELIDLAKSKPGFVTYASASTSQLLSTAMLAGMTGVQMTNVPYKSGPMAMTDLIGGQVMMFTADFAVTLPQVKNDKIRGLAVTSTKRSAAIPELPTIEEAAGLRGFEASSWFGLLAPAGTPADVVNRIQQEVAKSLASPAMKERLATLGAIPSGNTPAQFAALIESEHKKWAEVVKVSGAKVD